MTMQRCVDPAHVDDLKWYWNSAWRNASGMD